MELKTHNQIGLYPAQGIKVKEKRSKTKDRFIQKHRIKEENKLGNTLTNDEMMDDSNS